MKIRAALLLLLAGCASSGTHPSDELALASVLTVTNQRGEDASIYVVHAGIRGRRLGQVPSFGSATFALTTSDAPIASDVQFLAKMLITGVVDMSDPIGAERGAAYDWKLGPGHHFEFLSLRYPGRRARALAAARSRSNSRSRTLRVRVAARSNSARASSVRPSFARRSPRTLGKR